jgi:hypothetical protein
MHFFGLSFYWLLVESHEGTLEIVNQGVSLPGFYDYIIDIGFNQIILDLIGKVVLDSTLIRGPRVLKPE